MHAHPQAMACIRDCYAHFERHDVATRGVNLITYEAGPEEAPVVVIVSPIGVPLLVVSRLALQLASRYRVVCWEQRGMGESSVSFLGTRPEYVDYVADVLAVVSQRAKSLAAVIGVCSGAALAIKAAAPGSMPPHALLLVSPAIFFSDGYVPSQFDTSVTPFMRMIDGTNRGLAEDLFDLRRSSRRTTLAETVSDLEVMEAADTLSVASIDSLLVYSRIVRVFTDQKLDRELASTPSRVHVFATQDDSTVSIRATRRLCQLLPDAVLHEFAQGGHFSLYTRQEVRDAIVAVVNGLPAHAQAPREYAVGR